MVTGYIKPNEHCPAMRNVLRITLLSSILFLLLIDLNAKSHNEQKNLFFEANNHLLYQEYEAALQLLDVLLSYQPDNANYMFLAGLSSLKIPGKEKKALDFLREAAKNTSIRYKENSFKETSAPVEALFHLGKAYQYNQKIDSAIQSYMEFQSYLGKRETETIELVNHQITTCNNAKELTSRPSNLKTEWANDLSDNDKMMDLPVISGDGKTLVYYSFNDGKPAILISKKVNHQWTNAEEILKGMTFSETTVPASLSYDGSSLYLIRKDKGNENIYVTHFQDGKWQKMQKLGNTINTKGMETHASVSKNDSILFFTSNRRGGYGGLDIYLSCKQQDGTWGTARNLGRTVNSHRNEETPFMASDNKTLFFSSEGHFNMGGFDVFKSITGDFDTFSKPENLGIPVNTTRNDLAYMPVNNPDKGFYFRDFQNESVQQGIQYVYLDEEKPGKLLTLSGEINLSDNRNHFGDISLTVINTKSRDTLNIKPQVNTGIFSERIEPGTYQILAAGNQYKPSERYLDLSGEGNSSNVALNIHLDRQEKNDAELLARDSENDEGDLPAKNAENDDAGLSDRNAGGDQADLPDSHSENDATDLQNMNSGNHDTNLLAANSGSDETDMLNRNREKDETNLSDRHSKNDEADVLATNSDNDDADLLTAGFENQKSALHGHAGQTNIEKINHNNLMTSKGNALPPNSDKPVRSNDTEKDPVPPAPKKETSKYTIQLIALKSPVNASPLAMDGIKVTIGNDAFHRYTFGEYDSYDEVLENWEALRDKGYTEAFITRTSKIQNYHSF